MRAVIQSSFGDAVDVLAVEEIERPGVGPDEVLVRVHAAGVAKGMWLITQGLPYIARPSYGIRTPKVRVAGLQFAGTVVETGNRVESITAGDAVFGHGAAFADFVVATTDNITSKPANISFEQGAAVPISGVTALQAVRDAGGILPGQRVLVLGASGGVGSFVVQIAKAYGAEVTAVASTRNLSLLSELGADHVSDYTREDATAGSPNYDVIIDIAGNRPLSRVRRALASRGTLVIVGGTGGRWTMGFQRTIGGMLLAPFISQNIIGMITKQSHSDLVELAELMASGKLSPVVAQSFPLERTAEAVDAMGALHGAGTIVVAVA